MTAVRIFAALAGGVLAILAITGFWLWRAAPVPMPDAPGGRFACVSYAPFRGEQTPFDPTLVIPRAQIEEDLTHLKTESDCVRIYAVNQGLDQVLPIAETLGMKVLMGLWIGRDGPGQRDPDRARHRAGQGASRHHQGHHRRQRGAAAPGAAGLGAGDAC